MPQLSHSLRPCVRAGLAVLLLLAASVAHAAATGFAWELIYELKRDVPLLKNVHFLMLTGAPTVTRGDHRLLKEGLARLGVLKQPEAQELLARYQRMRGQRSFFRVDPVGVPTLSGIRHICVLKLDEQTAYTRDEWLAFLRVTPPELEQAGVDLTRLSVARLQQHMVAHELWHCLEAVEEAAILRFASRIVETGFDQAQPKLLQLQLRNHAEAGADLFATMMDMRQYGDCQMVNLMTAVRQANLDRRDDLEHFSVPALGLLRQVRPSSLGTISLLELIERLEQFRQQGVDLELLAALYAARVGRSAD